MVSGEDFPKKTNPLKHVSSGLNRGSPQEFYLDLIDAKTSTKVASATLVILSNEDPYTGAGHRVTVFFFVGVPTNAITKDVDLY